MSNPRLIFPDLKLFKKTLVENFIIATQVIYKEHPIYSFDDTAANTKIHILPTYANSQFDDKAPSLLIKAGGYDFSLLDTLNQNMLADAQNSLGVIGGFSSLKNMSTVITIKVEAYAEEESSDIADEFVMLAGYAARGVYGQVGIIINGSEVSETQSDGSTDDKYITVVNISVDVPWQLSNVYNADASDPGTEVDGDGGLPISGYRPPGVYPFNSIYDYHGSGE